MIDDVPAAPLYFRPWVRDIILDLRRAALTAGGSVEEMWDEEIVEVRKAMRELSERLDDRS